MSPQCNLARQEAKGKPVESWERSDAKSLWFWGQVPASEATTFARHAAKPGSFAREGGKLGGGFLLSPRTSLGSALMGACKDEHKSSIIFRNRDYLYWRRFATTLVIFRSSESSKVDVESRKTARSPSKVCSEQRSTPRSSTEDARWRRMRSPS